MKMSNITNGLFCVLFLSKCNYNTEAWKVNSSVQPSIIMEDCYNQNNNVDIGIGLLLWDGDCDIPVQFYLDKELKQRVYELNFCNKVSGICPLFFKPDYGIMHFAIKNKSNYFYEVYVNDTNTLYLPFSKSFSFVSWEDFLINNTTGVRETNGQVIYTVKSVKGDLITVENELTTSQKEIKWNDNNKLVIEIMLLI